MKRIPALIWRLGLSVLAVGVLGAAPTDIAQEAFDLRLAGKDDEAVQRLEEGLAADSTQAILFYELSRTRMFLLDIEGMQEAIERAVALAPDNSGYHHFAGMASGFSVINAAHHQQQEQMAHFAQMAFDELEAAIRCDPANDEARCLLVELIAGMAEDMGWDLEKAEEQAGVLEAKDPVWGAKARACLVSEDQKAELWEKVVREHSDRWQAWYEAGGGFIELGKPDRAAECIDRALEMNPQTSEILLRLATSFAMTEDWDKARATTRRYIDLDPPLPLLAFAWARLGQIEERSGNPASGQELMDKALAMDPHLWRGFMPPPKEIFTRP
jgi:tetratricopeptide (TPR) repeat protein